jgi:hypothetical protein
MSPRALFPTCTSPPSLINRFHTPCRNPILLGKGIVNRFTWSDLARPLPSDPAPRPHLALLAPVLGRWPSMGLSAAN